MDNFGRPVPGVRPSSPSRPSVPPRPETVQTPPVQQPTVPAPSIQTVAPVQPEPTTDPAEQPSPVAPQPIGSDTPKSKKSKKRRIVWALVGLLGLIIATLASIFIWFSAQLAPVDSKNTTKQVVVIETGTTPTGIATTLKEKELIRNVDAFLWYTRFQGVQNSLQAGTYRLSPSESTQEIVTHLTKGNVDTFDITFLPGATLADNRKVLIEAGYSETEVDTALRASYDSPLFEGRPAGADLEGYIYGDTYKFGSGASVESILSYIFEAYYAVIQKENLVEQYRAQGLSLYEGITLASIIQRESIGGDEPQIAQVFFKRLSIDMPLGSDVTYQYIADKTGVQRDPNLDSPYNTRRYPGLPPGPIAVPGINSLKAVAKPAPGDYLYFLSGDDDVTYFGRTLEEHERNIVDHCKQKCQII